MWLSTSTRYPNWRILLAKHVYIIDTCVLLHDPTAVFKFQEHDIYLPLAVIDDLDEIKTRRDTVGWSAREVFRILDKFDESQLTKGVKVNDLGGKLFIYNTEAPLTKNDRPAVCRVNSDNAIIDACLHLKSQYPKRKVVIVTKDTGLRVRSLSWQCQAENYRSDLLDDDLYTGIKYVKVETSKDWDLLWQAKDCMLEIQSLPELIRKQLENLMPNEFVFFKYGENICPSMHKKGFLKIMKDKSNGVHHGKAEYMGISAKNIEQRCALEILSDEYIPLVCLLGSAGVGKSLMSVAVALEKINNGVYERLIVIKPTVPVGGVDLGALPGSKFEKLSAWLGPIKDSCEQLVSNNSKNPATNSFEELVEKNIIEAEGLPYIQGRSFINTFIILDEAQNINPRVCRMAVERCGAGSKIVLLGDLSQVENPFLDARSCGLAHAVNGGKLQQVCAAITLTKVERSELAAIASEIFKSPEAHR